MTRRDLESCLLRRLLRSPQSLLYLTCKKKEQDQLVPCLMNCIVTVDYRLMENRLRLVSPQVILYLVNRPRVLLLLYTPRFDTTMKAVKMKFAETGRLG